MYLHYKSQLKTWSIYFGTLLIAVLIHEIGHCIVAWSNGIAAIPTPAKAYYLSKNTAPHLSDAFSLGGVAGSIIFSLATITTFFISRSTTNSPVFAGALAMPGMYSLLFIVKGRGHDGTEFQKAQAALGLSFSGHFLDWLFVTIFVTGVFLWILTGNRSRKLVFTVVLGAALSIVFLYVLQDVNNKIFDPLFD